MFTKGEANGDRFPQELWAIARNHILLELCKYYNFIAHIFIESL
ncbi:hypothetical protein [Aphanizomenon flos-aquae]|nr:hypothetical protein [Aphanizomenon flos-aquae]